MKIVGSLPQLNGGGAPEIFSESPAFNVIITSICEPTLRCERTYIYTLTYNDPVTGVPIT
jgi:hypothetical protein